jgi:hypothetical protein
MATITIKNNIIVNIQNGTTDISVIEFQNSSNTITNEITIDVAGFVSSYLYNANNIKYTFNANKLTLIESSTTNMDINLVTVLTDITNRYNEAVAAVDFSIQNGGDWQGSPLLQTSFQTITTIGNGTNAISAIATKIRTITIGAPINRINPLAFANQSALTTVTGSSVITSLNSQAFVGCTALTSIDISSVTNIPSNAFNDCNHLISVTLGSGLISIGESAFSGCTLLPAISLPSGLSSIGGQAFAGCASLAQIVIPENTTFLGTANFQGCGIIKIIFLAAYSSLSSNIINILAGFQNSPTVKVYYLDGKAWPGSVTVNSGGYTTLFDVINLKTITDGSLSAILPYYTDAGGLQVSNSSGTYYYAFNPGYVAPGGGGSSGGGGGTGVPGVPGVPGAVCFLGKAPVLTPSGYRRIDSLKVGDLVTTAEGEAVPIHTVFIKSYSPSNTVNPYIIPKGQFGATMNIAISPDHLVQTAEGKMVKARFLGLEQKEMSEDFNYYNIELPNYEQIIVAGVTVESKYPTITAELTLSQLSKFLEENSEVLTPEVLSQLKTGLTRTANGKVQLHTLKRNL